MKRFLAVLVALGLVGAFAMGCQKKAMEPGAGEKGPMKMEQKIMPPPPPPPPPPAMPPAATPPPATPPAGQPQQ